MHKGFLRTAAIVGILSVAFGAFGAHALKNTISDNAVNIFETAVRYQFYHVFALLATGILYKDFTNKYVKWAGGLFIAGILLFSGSLYVLTYVTGAVKPGYKWIGAITPVGGLLLITAWLFLFIGTFKKLAA